MRKPSAKNDAIRRTRRADDTANCRRRQRLGLQLLKIEVGGWECDLASEYAGLRTDQIGNKNEVAAALGRLLRKALVALITQEENKKK